MCKFKKTCYYTNTNKTKKDSHNKKPIKAKNNSMKNIKDSKPSCTMHVMPPQITDQDITALFNGIINIVRKKIELETKAEILNCNISLEKVLKKLKEKEAECVRLKNEIIYLKSELNKQKQFNNSQK